MRIYFEYKYKGQKETFWLEADDEKDARAKLRALARAVCTGLSEWEGVTL